MEQVRRRQARPALRPAAHRRDDDAAAAERRRRAALRRRARAKGHHQGAAPAGGERRLARRAPRPTSWRSSSRASARAGWRAPRWPTAASGRSRRWPRTSRPRRARRSTPPSAPRPATTCSSSSAAPSWSTRCSADCACTSATSSASCRRAQWNFCWVTELPAVRARRGDRSSYVAAHHPFTAPRAEDVPLLESDPGQGQARAYDLVLNGNEIAGGSLRIYQRDVQAKVFAALGLTRGRFPRQVRLPPRRVQVRAAAARRHRVRRSIAWPCSCAAPSRCAT